MKEAFTMNTILDFSKERIRTFLLCLFFLALSTRLCAVFFYTFLPNPGTEINLDYEYGIIAKAIAGGKGYSAPVVEFDSDFIPKNFIDYKPTANQTPFFPYFLSIFYSITSDTVALFLVRFVHAIFSALTCVIVYVIALRLIHYKAAFILGILCTCYPLFISVILRIVPETFFTFFLSLTILYLLILKESPSRKNIIITGMLIGVTLLNSNVIMPFIFLIGIWLLLNIKDTFRNKLLKISFVFIITILVISPWLIRNFVVFNKFPLLKSTAGFNLWLGNNPSASGTFFSKSREDVNLIILRKFPKAFDLSEVERDSIFYGDAINFIKTNPLYYLKSVLKRFYYFWWFPPDGLVSGNVNSYKIFMAVPYLILLISCTIGMVTTMRENWQEGLLLIALMLSISLLYSLFVVGHLRYRVPIEPYILLFASQTIFLFIRGFVRMCVHPYRNRIEHNLKSN